MPTRMGPRFGSPRGTKPSLFLAALVAGIAPGAADASQSDDPLAKSFSFHGSSPDGTHAYIQTREQLVKADTDQMVDVYDIDDGVAELVSYGPDGGNRDGTCLYVDGGPDYPPYFESCNARFQGASGGRVYFRSESLRSAEPANGLYEYHRDGDSLALTEGAIAETEDNSVQILQDRFTGCLSKRDSSGTTLISTGPAVPGGGCPDFGDFHFVSQTDDGSTVFFLSTKPLVAADTDDQRDLYRSRNGETILISTGPADAGGGFTGTRYGSRRSGFETVSTADGETVVFKTSAKLTDEDEDSADDIYLRTGTTTTLASGTGASDVDLVGQSDDLGTIYFETADGLDPADTNGKSDVYRWKNGTTSLFALDPGGRAFAHGSTFLDSSVDGTRTFFYAWENAGFVTGEIYERSAGATTRISPPGIDYQYWSDWVGASDDGSNVYFDSKRPLTDDDDDGGKVDLYRYENGTLTLISADPSPIDPEDAEDATGAPGPLDDGDQLSDDGSRIYFKSRQSMSPADTDCGRTDLYEHSDSGNRLVTVGAGAPKIASGPCAFDTNEPTFNLEPANSGEALECRIDQGDYVPCSPTFTPEVDNGEHVLTVRGASTAPQSGVADRRFTIAADVPPDTTITDGPEYTWDFQNPDEYRRPAFSFESSEQSGHFECRFDDGAFEPCDQSDVGSTGMDRPDEPLSWGQHTFEVSAVDGAGNPDPTPDSRSFTISPYNGDLELELTDAGAPANLRRLGRDGLKPAVRCSEACRVKAEVTLSFKTKGKRRSIRFGTGRGGSGLKAKAVAVPSSPAGRRALRKVKRASLRIELTATPSDGDGGHENITRIEKLAKRRG
ncbi:MAG TPA: hypothetical protein VFS73_07710 [Solirubrobacterales bacterium]|nr:hypothetical protein [Solirubrobacterales bacterium]